MTNIIDDFALYPVAIGILVIYLVLKWWGAPTHKLQHIPTIGSSGIISSYRDASRFPRHGHEMIEQGYKKHYGTAFKVATMSRWLVIVSGPEMLDDIRRATDDQLSFRGAAQEVLQTDYTIGVHNRLDPYHVKVIRTTMTRKFGARLSDMQDEISQAFTDLLQPLKKDNTEWITVTAFNAARQVVCRTSNRVFVGLPLCRNTDYRVLNEDFTKNVVIKANFINRFPPFLKPIVGRLVSEAQSNIRRTAMYAGLMIQDRINPHDVKDGEIQASDVPNDLISWLLEEAKGPRRTVDGLAARLLNVNFVSIHTTSMALTNILYNLATYPEYIAPMREEAEEVIKAEGWTKTSLTKMRKIDSFVKESQRFETNAFTTVRKVLKDFTFSNGTTVPAGAHIASAGLTTHLDQNNYDNAPQFQGFRFADMREKDDEGTKHQMVSIDEKFLFFGTGRSACPGRFFAVSQLKITLAHILIHYDLKLATSDGLRPKALWTMGQVVPNMTAEVMFRQRSP